MKTNNIEKLILDNAQRLDQIWPPTNELFPEHTSLDDFWRKFWSLYDALAFPGGLDNGIALLKKGDEKTIDVAIEFLKADPRYFRSGYIKVQISRLLKRVALTDEQIKKIQQFLIDSVYHKHTREYRHYCRLAISVSDEEFVKKLLDIVDQANKEFIKQKARWMLARVQQARGNKSKNS